ncbi:MAG: GNAT family N-acetyltransferase [Promethearchaeota archaeon]|jgi:ribosomal protein S18 acetylase RimI-like enzyme
MTKADAPDVAEIHCEALADDFLASIGKSFLTTLYRCIISLDLGFGIVHEKNNRVAGVAVVTQNTTVFYKTLLLKGFGALMPKLLWSLIKRPSLLKRSLETLFYSKQESATHNPEAELIVLVLRREYQRQGIGSEILCFLNKEFGRRGVKCYIVRTYADNEGSNNFYTTNGFTWQDSFMMYNRRWNLYKRETDEQAT